MSKFTSILKSQSFCFGIVVFVATACLPSAVHAQSSRAQEVMQDHQDRIAEMRKKSSDSFEEMRRESDERMAEARQRQEEVFSDLENRSSSSSSSSNSSGGFRIRGRAIKGIIFLVVALGAGAMKLFGFASGNRGE